MGNDLNEFFVTFKIFKDGTQVHEMESPISAIQYMFSKWAFPGSPYTVRIIDSTGNFRLDSTIFG